MVITDAMNRPAPDRSAGMPADGRYFLSCDWGTSAFRLRQVNADSLETVATVSEGDGILATFRAWQASGRPAEARMSFYLDRLRESIRRLPMDDHSLLAGAPVILSGMASSSIGMTTLPYTALPFAADGSELQVAIVPPTPDFEHPLAVISGACTGTDVMRGEETMLVGAIDELGRTASDCVVILPGTHSKHVFVKGGRVVDFATYMTGEFFALLSTQSILSHSIEPGDGLGHALNRDCFTRGVLEGERGELLRDCFSIRARQLLYDEPAESGYYRLSGLLVGNELKGLPAQPSGDVVLVCSPGLFDYYETALRIVAPSARVVACGAERSLARGQRMVAIQKGLLQTAESAGGPEQSAN